MVALSAKIILVIAMSDRIPISPNHVKIKMKFEVGKKYTHKYQGNLGPCTYIGPTCEGPVFETKGGYLFKSIPYVDAWKEYVVEHKQYVHWYKAATGEIFAVINTLEVSTFPSLKTEAVFYTESL
jgi:hypothetical protein